MSRYVPAEPGKAQQGVLLGPVFLATARSSRCRFFWQQQEAADAEMLWHSLCLLACMQWYLKLWAPSHRLASRPLLLSTLFLSTACGTCKDAEEEASAFLQDTTNLECESDSDCVVVSTGCAEVPGAFCHQVQLSKLAAETKGWQLIQEDLDSCGPKSCVSCLALLLPHCSSGQCGSGQN